MGDEPKKQKALQGIDPERLGTFLPREGTRRSYKAQGLARLMPKVTRQIAGKRPTLMSELQSDWHQIVGEDLARFTRPNRLKAQVLHLDVAMGAGPVIAMQQDLMLAKVNRHLGAGKVQRLTLHQVDFPQMEIASPKPHQDFVSNDHEPLTDAGRPPNNATKVGSALENLKTKLERRTSVKKQPPSLNNE